MVMLKAEHLSFRCGNKNLLHDVSLELHTGEILAVLGANGAGKSTLLKILSGDYKPCTGQVSFHGRALSDWQPRQLARLRAVLPQSASLSFPFPVRDVVMMGRSPHQCSRQEHQRSVQQAMHQAEIIHLSGRDYTTLSGGERQRVHLARVLTQLDHTGEQGRCLLLDEPTASLDLAHQHHLLRLLREQVASRALGVLIIEHDLNLAAPRVICLRQGEVYAAGTVQDTLHPSVIKAVYGIAMQVVEVAGGRVLAVTDD